MAATQAKLTGVFDDTEPPSRLRAEQDAAVRAYVSRQVYPYSTFNRTRLSASGFGPLGIRSTNDLRAVPPVSWSEVGDGVDLLLRPHRTTITKLGSTSMTFRLLLSSLVGRRERFERNWIDPVYRPIHWLVQQGVPVGVTANDLERMSEIGRRWLEAAGVARSDVIASVIPAGPHLDFWQLATGARRGGVPVAFLEVRPDPEDVARLRPTVLAGRPNDVLETAVRAREYGPAVLGGVHTVLLTGELPEEGAGQSIQRQIGREVRVLSAWAPPGVRAMWAACKGATGLHTWPAADIIDVVDPVTLEPQPPGAVGEIVWSALGWAGSVVLRLRTGVKATIDIDACPACRRTTPRILPAAVAPAVATFAPVLDAHPGVSAWQGELSQRNGDEELVIFIAPSRPGHPGRLVRELDEKLKTGQAATQFIVLTAAEINRRIEQNGHNQIVDRRT
jgi:phenylacetate-coenzyme A ligase PaaK-like adenylate-forming protein